MPIRQKVVALILIHQGNPIAQSAPIVAEMLAACGPAARNNDSGPAHQINPSLAKNPKANKEGLVINGLISPRAISAIMMANP